MLTVTIQQSHRISAQFLRFLETRIQRSALALVALVADHEGAGRLGDLGGGVGRAVVDDDHGVSVGPGPQDHAADEPFLVVRRDDGYDSLSLFWRLYACFLLNGHSTPPATLPARPARGRDNHHLGLRG
jgi:hypothetical protein